MNKTSALAEQLTNLLQLFQQDEVDHKAVKTIFSTAEETFLTEAKEIEYDPHFQDHKFEPMRRAVEQDLLNAEKKLANLNPVTLIQEQTKELKHAFQQFWTQTGFHFVDQFHVNENGNMEVKVGFALHLLTFDDRKRVSGYTQTMKTITQLEREGYILDEQKKRLRDCDANIEKILTLLKEQFPSIRLRKKQSRAYDGHFYLDRLEMLITNPIEL